MFLSMFRNFSNKKVNHYYPDGYEILKMALAGMAQWIEHQPPNQKVAGSIPRQGTCLRFGPGPQLGV